jgi:hypothetical protein
MLLGSGTVAPDLSRIVLALLGPFDPRLCERLLVPLKIPPSISGSWLTIVTHGADRLDACGPLPFQTIKGFLRYSAFERLGIHRVLEPGQFLEHFPIVVPSSLINRIVPIRRPPAFRLMSPHPPQPSLRESRSCSA